MNSQYLKRREWFREYYKQNRERIRAQHAEYKSKNKEREREKHQEWHRRTYVPSLRIVQTPAEREVQRKIYRQRELQKRHASPALTQRNRVRARQWELNNPERRKVQAHRNYEVNKEKVKERTAKWQEANRNRVNELSRRRYIENLEYSRMCSRVNAAKRLATKVKAPGSYSVELWVKKVEFYGFRCYYCNANPGIGKLEQEHAIPLSRGGTNFLANIVPACARCNRRKHTKTITEYLKLYQKVR